MDYITYANQGATRNQQLDPELAETLAYLEDMGLVAEVFSGGQPGVGSGEPRVGTTRHDHGRAADLFLTRDGERLDWARDEDRPVFEEFVRRGREAGLTGFGAGEGYMQPGSMHVGYGTPAVWGAEGDGSNAPDWLSEAYGGVPAGGQRQAALGEDREAGIDEDPSAFRQWYDRADGKLRDTLGLPDRDSLTDGDRSRMANSQMLIQNGLRMMNGGFS